MLCFRLLRYLCRYFRDFHFLFFADAITGFVDTITVHTVNTICSAANVYTCATLALFFYFYLYLFLGVLSAFVLLFGIMGVFSFFLSVPTSGSFYYKENVILIVRRNRRRYASHGKHHKAHQARRRGTANRQEAIYALLCRQALFILACRRKASFYRFFTSKYTTHQQFPISSYLLLHCRNDQYVNRFPVLSARRYMSALLCCSRRIHLC